MAVTHPKDQTHLLAGSVYANTPEQGETRSERSGGEAPIDRILVSPEGGELLTIRGVANAVHSTGLVHSSSVLSPSRVTVAMQHTILPTGEKRFVFLTDPDSSRAARYRILRQRLRERGNPQALMVTSAERAEGKTTCAINLAMALAEHGDAHVLLLEANLRTPALGLRLGFTPPVCFSEQLSLQAAGRLGSWHVVEAFSPMLHVLAMDPSRANPQGRLLNGYVFGAAMEQLRTAGYDHIVIDSPCILGSADVNVLQDSVDGVLLTAWGGRSSSKRIRHAAEQLAPTHILGVVVINAGA